METWIEMTEAVIGAIEVHQKYQAESLEDRKAFLAAIRAAEEAGLSNREIAKALRLSTKAYPHMVRRAGDGITHG